MKQGTRKRVSTQHPTRRGRRGARLGQHFFTRPEIAGWVADAIPLTRTSTVLEIGPGHGILTRELLKRAGKVVAVEKDPALVAELHETFAEDILRGALVLIEQDVREFDPETLRPTPYTLVANIPYYITGYIIRKFLTTPHQPQHMAMLIQKEVAERIVAKDGKESLLSLSVKVYGTPRLVHTVKAGAFSPAPAVDSAVLAIGNIGRNMFCNSEEERQFFELLHTAFQGPRKQVGHLLKHRMPKESLVLCGVNTNRRPGSVPVEEWLALTRAYLSRVGEVGI